MISSLLKDKLPDGVNNVMIINSLFDIKQERRVLSDTLFMRLEGFEFTRVSNHIKNSGKFIKRFINNGAIVSLYEWLEKEVVFSEFTGGNTLTIKNAGTDLSSHYLKLQEEIDSLIGQVRSGSVIVRNGRRYLVIKAEPAETPFETPLMKFTLREVRPSVQYEKPEFVGEVLEISEEKLKSFSLEDETKYINKIWVEGAVC